jgi:DNA invertase Pin-like site-specific DNA recombinase
MSLGRVVREIDPDMNMPRPGLEYALERLAGEEFACLVVTRLDRLAGSASELAALVREFERQKVRLVVTEIDFDSAARASRVAAGALARPDRIDDGHGSRPVRPVPMSGTLAGHPELRQRIVDMRARGMTLQAIADTLNAEGVPTVRGGTEWRPSSLYGALGQRRPPRTRR